MEGFLQVLLIDSLAGAASLRMTLGSYRVNRSVQSFTVRCPSVWDTTAKSGIEPMLGKHLTLREALVQVHKEDGSRGAPGEHDRVGSAGGDCIKERHKFQQNTLLVIVNLVKVRLSEIHDISGSEVAVL